MAVWLVTGSSGFIGGRLVEVLRGAGLDVAGLDRLPLPGRTDIVADIRQSGNLFEEFSRLKPAAVLHLAALGGVRASVEDPVPYAESNVLGSSFVLEAARRSGVSKVVLVSSSSVYGDSAVLPLSEDMPCVAPLSPYAAGKRSMELAGWVYHRTYGMDVTLVRPFSVYGPRCRPELVVRKFLLAALRGTAVQVYGDGNAARDFTYVDDVVHGIRLAALHRGWGIYNLGGGRSVSVNELIELIRSITGRNLTVEYAEARPGEVAKTAADISRAAAELGWRPEVGMEEGLGRTWQWLLENSAE
ncbi:MAG: GDP-mannose 4,6-dehydratase [Planctomycetes bacterium]|nr:GDP-mannose 4,6-dehydratase [Planctomycetota bacterium]